MRRTPALPILSACALLAGCDAADPTLTRLVAGAAGSALYVASTRLWSGPIPVCWENPTSDNAAGRAAVRDAVETSWSRAAALRFSGWDACRAGARGVRVRIADEGPHTQGLGTALSGVKDGMVLNFTFTTWSPGCQATTDYCIRAGAIHEFGHALGFAHEQNRPDRPGWCGLEQGAPGDALIGPWDLDSIMNYCNPRWTGDGKLSATDIVGARAAYGSGGGDIYVAPAAARAFEAPLRSQTGAGATQALLGDVTGDGQADAVLFFVGSGDWWVAPASGAAGALAGYTRWRSGHGAGALPLLGDVTGDGRADAVAFYATSGEWWVAPALPGGGFGPYGLWQRGHGRGAAALLGDVTGDGRADAVAFYAQDGAWWVAPSTGASFGPYGLWQRGHGQGGAALLGDVTGDGKADAVAFYAQDGAWWVAPATAAAFAPYSRWALGLLGGARDLLLADVTGDGRADAVGFTPEGGAFSVAPALGGAQVGGGDHFGPSSVWISGHGTSLGATAVQPLVGDVTGDGRADAAVFWRR